MLATTVVQLARQKLADYAPQFPDDVTLTGTLVITEVRTMTSDAATTYRVADADMLNFINDGQRFIVQRLPWLLWKTDSTSRTYADASSTSATLFVPTRFKDALVQYVVHRVNSIQASDKYDEHQAQVAMKLFEELIATANTRWTNIMLENYLNEGLQDIWQERSHLRVKDDGTFNTFAYISVADTVPSTTLCLPDEAQPALVAFIVWQALEHGLVNQAQVVAAQRWQAEYVRLLEGI